MMPFNLTVFFTAMLIVRLYDRLTPRQIGRYGFILCAIALVWLAFVVRNDGRYCSGCSFSASGRVRWSRCCSTCW
jgi:hypothetical protein